VGLRYGLDFCRREKSLIPTEIRTPNPQAPSLVAIPPIYKHRDQQDSQCTYNVILKRVRVSLLRWNSNKCYISVCVCACSDASAGECEFARVALLIQYATRMRHFVSSFVASPTPLYFSTLSHNRQDFRGRGES
jgi:hypothetical protein